MLVVLLSVLLVLETALLAVGVRYLWKFVKIILIFEDDIDELLVSLQRVENSIANILNMQMFFDSPEVKKAAQDIVDEFNLSRSVVSKLIQNFTARSKQQYITTWDSPAEMPEQIRYVSRLPGQPPDTPNPLEIIQNEGIVLDVRRR